MRERQSIEPRGQAELLSVLRRASHWGGPVIRVALMIGGAFLVACAAGQKTSAPASEPVPAATPSEAAGPSEAAAPLPQYPLTEIAALEQQISAALARLQIQPPGEISVSAPEAMSTAPRMQDPS